MRLALISLVAISAFAQEPQPEDTSTTFKVKVSLVSVYATVTTASGAPVTDLKKEDFRVSEDGNPERVAVFEQESERPISIVMAIDASASVKKDIRLELNSARRFVAATVRPVDKVALYQFSDSVVELVPFTDSLTRLSKGLDRIRTGAGTSLFDAIYLGGMALSHREGRKVMVLITDGGDTTSSTSYQAALRAAQQSEALVYSIIVVPVEEDPGRNVGGENALIQLAHDTGGKYYYASSAGDLDAAFKQISKELRTQYLLGYYPSRRIAEGNFRRIKIDVKASQPLVVRHRAGYYTSKIE